MKKTAILLICSLACVAGLMTSCGEDDDHSGINPTDVTAKYSNKSAESNLTLTYDGGNMAGKSVDFSTTEGKTGTITLYDIIPGEKELKTAAFPLVENAMGYSFTGSETSGNGTTFNYNGSVEKGSLVLSLTEIKIAGSHALANTYRFSDVTIGIRQAIDYGETGELEWVELDNQLLTGAGYGNAYMEATEDGLMGFKFNSLLQQAFGYLLPQLLQDITLEENGNVSASYSTEPIVGLDFENNLGGTITTIVGWISGSLTQKTVTAVTQGRTYTPSPKGLIYWYPKNKQIILKINLPAIIGQLAQGSNQDMNQINGMIDAVLQMDALKVKELLVSINKEMNDPTLTILTSINDDSFKGIFNWLAMGIPMDVMVKEGRTILYLDKEELTPILKLVPDLFPVLIAQLPDNIKNNSMIMSIINQVKDWPGYALKADVFDVGIDLVLKN